jgi:hypothetical protein
VGHCAGWYRRRARSRPHRYAARAREALVGASQPSQVGRLLMTTKQLELLTGLVERINGKGTGIKVGGE